MNKFIYVKRFLFLLLCCNEGIAQNCARIDKRLVQRPFIEHSKAVDRYRDFTRIYFLNSEKLSGKALSYELELRYLFNNYEKLSTFALLSRIRSAHRDMIKISGSHGEIYERYEQICSVLLLQCAQIFAENARKQLLDALGDVDDELCYWKYQKNHPMSYFFGKSPGKWLKGKSQEKEINDNMRKLERKQAELYVILGKLVAHVYNFANYGNGYTECYDWIEELFSLLSCVKITPKGSTDGSRFDAIASRLELKIKHVRTLRNNSLQSVFDAKRPHHIVRHWIAYTSLAVAITYALHYHLHHEGAVLAAYIGAKVTVLGFLSQLLDPLHKMYVRGRQAFSTEVKKNNDDAKLLDTSLTSLITEIENVGLSIKGGIAAELAKSETSLLQDAEVLLDAAFDILEARCIFRRYAFDRDAIKKAALGEKIILENKTEFIGGGDFTLFDEFVQQISWLDIDVTLQTKSARALICTVKGFLEPLQRYTDIIDHKILRLIELIAMLVVALGRKADDKLQDNELTLMFTALIPLAGTSFAAMRFYRWITAKNYSPIRLALVDVNALLIEALLPLDDYDYGKLVYLIHKLRDKAYLLHSAVQGEFLADIAKLESKSFSVETKRSIVENMFNKYTFLGRIVT